MSRRSGKGAKRKPGRARGTRRAAAIAATVAALLALALGLFVLRPARTTRPNILLITLDTTRADHLGAYGYRLANTPRIDRLAGDGVLFERAVASAPITLPAHASLLTGLYPFAHGVRNNGNFSLDDAVPTLATTLHDRGFRTAAFVSAFVLDRRYGLSRGFDVYDDRVRLERRGDRTAAAAIEWLDRRDRSAPFFLWLHLYDPHDPYTPPPPYSQRFRDRPYDGEIAFDDAVIASVLDHAGAADPGSTIVAIVGDHGEGLGEHQEATHAVFVYDATLRVPMILSWPGHLPPRRRVTELVRGVDLAPTLLDLAGAPPLPSAQGRSLASIARGDSKSTPPFAYAETYFPLLYMNWAPLRSIQDGRWKYIEAPSPELYDLDSDPGESMNLFAREAGRAAALRAALDKAAGSGQGRMSERPIDRDTTAKLAALGYVGGGTVRRAEEARPDPKRMIGVFNALRQANAALGDHRPAEAASMARSALDRDPSNAFATIVLARADFDQGKYREAIDGYRAYAGLVPSSADAHHRIAICYSRLGDVDAALAESDAALAIDPRFADAHDLRGGLLASRGRLDEGVRELEMAIEVDPDDVPFRVGLARILISAGRLAEAESQVRRALELRPDDSDAHAAHAALLAASGRFDVAAGEYERALSVRPDADDVRLDLARTLDRLGRTMEARKQYQQLASGRDTVPEIRRAAQARLR